MKVAFPEGYAGPAAWQTVKEDKRLAYFMQTGDARQAEGVVAKAEQVVRDYADSQPAKQLAFALGRYYLAQGETEAALMYLKEAAWLEYASPLRACVV